MWAGLCTVTACLPAFCHIAALPACLQRLAASHPSLPPPCCVLPCLPACSSAALCGCLTQPWASWWIQMIWPPHHMPTIHTLTEGRALSPCTGRSTACHAAAAQPPLTLFWPCSSAFPASDFMRQLPITALPFTPPTLRSCSVCVPPPLPCLPLFLDVCLQVRAAAHAAPFQHPPIAQLAVWFGVPECETTVAAHAADRRGVKWRAKVECAGCGSCSGGSPACSQQRPGEGHENGLQVMARTAVNPRVGGGPSIIHRMLAQMRQPEGPGGSCCN